MYIVFALVVLAIATISVYSSEALWISVVCWSVFAIGVVGIIDAALSFVMLDESELRMRHTFRTNVIPRSEIKSVSVAKGCPIRLQLSDGTRVDVPDLGASGIANSLRAWIGAT